MALGDAWLGSDVGWVKVHSAFPGGVSTDSRGDFLHFNVISCYFSDMRSDIDQLATRWTTARYGVFKRSWANEAFRVASAQIYQELAGTGGTREGIVLSPGYVSAKSTIARRQRLVIFL